jgi:hypothetical protein
MWETQQRIHPSASMAKRFYPIDHCPERHSHQTANQQRVKVPKLMYWPVGGRKEIRQNFRVNQHIGRD